MVRGGYMEQNREYNIGKIYGNVKLLELFRNEKDKRLMAKVEREYYKGWKFGYICDL